MNILVLYNFAPHTTANYLVRALRAEGHDVRTAGGADDMRGWPNPYRLAGPHDWLLAEGQPLDTGGWRPDLAVWVESGTLQAEALEGLDCPCACWLIDTHNPGKWPWHQQVARAFDHVFCAMLPAAQALPGATWLPLACDPEIHTPRVLPAEPEFDIAYVGNAYSGGMYQRRFETLRAMRRRYRVQIASGVYFEDMADVYGNARIGWNQSLTGGDLVMRVFEVMCSGRPLVTDEAVQSGIGLLDGIGPGVCVGYTNEGSMYENIDALLADAELARIVGARGRQVVMDHHTYAHRARQLIEVCDG